MSVLAATVALSIAGLVAPTPASAVVGGSTAQDGAFAFMASVQDESGFSFCGGSVISSEWVLTAAHCVSDGSAAGVYVVTGRIDLTSDTGQRIAVSQVYVHPSYADNAHDVALLRLSSATVSPPIRLATAADDALEAAGTPVAVAGWGDQTPTFGLNSTTSLRHAELRVVSDAECAQTNVGFDAATGVCAAALAKDSCQGDSGGPLFATAGGEPVQVGVVSYGVGCAVPGFPGIYSEVNSPAIRAWIAGLTGV